MVNNYLWDTKLN